MSMVKKLLTTTLAPHVICLANHAGEVTKEHKGSSFYPLTFMYSPALACGASVVSLVVKELFVMEVV